MKFYPYKRKGEQIFVLAVLKGGGGSGTKSFEVVLTWELEILAIVIGGGERKKFPPFKVRLPWLGVVSQYPGKIYSFLFSTDILIMIINH